ncbi:MAG: hypothetical protein Q9201_004441 [Fulgogasparrea decipioides]
MSEGICEMEEGLRKGFEHKMEGLLLIADLLPFHLRSIINKTLIRYDGFKASSASFPFLWSLAELNHAVLNICLFPPLFFFYGLYYTDVWSALSVLITFQFHQRKWRKSMVAAGIASLLFRQTNIFWVAIYLGGLEVVRKLRRGRPGVEYPTKSTVLDVVSRSWQHVCVYDPLISQASFEDYIKCTLSFVAAAIPGFFILFTYLKTYLVILGAFTAFVAWNEGVVLGDKENHVASIHLAQMLYIWPYIMFFSFPLLYPYIINAIIPQKRLPTPLRTGSTAHQVPRFIVGIPVMAIMTLIIRYNTIIHPFTLADNRHYTFYVFRLLLRHPSIKYLVVPIYSLCAWAAITALGGLPNVQTPTKTKDSASQRTQIRRGLQHRLPPPSYDMVIDRGHHVSAALIWLLATSLSVITAPLVEPRYFIVPWLIWRLHVPNPRPTGEEGAKRMRKKIRGFREWCKAVLWWKHDHRLWLETAWFLFVNWAVGYMFLCKGFEWEQEKGKVQRFMW